MKIINYDHYYEYRCTDPKEFWHLLDPINPLEKNFSFFEKKKLLYRGQEDTSFYLMPSFFRNKYKIDEKSKDFVTIQKAFDFIYQEYNSLKDYYSTEMVIKTVNEKYHNINLQLLFDDEEFKKKITQNLNILLEKEYYDVVSLAQHHGISTSLLDWSKKSYVSAFFAAEPCINKKCYGNENLAIWIYLPYENSPIKIKEGPLAFDENMSSQKCCFTIVNQEMKKNEPIHIKTLDMICKKDKLWKITLPRSNAPVLMEFCNLNNISAENVYATQGLDSYHLSKEEENEWMSYINKIDLPSYDSFLDEV